MTGHRRLYAIAVLLLAGVAIVRAVVVALNSFPRGLTVLACGLLAVGCVWWGLLRRGVERILGLGAGVVLIIGALAIVTLEGHILLDALILAAVLHGLSAAEAEAVQRDSYRDAKLRTLVDTMPSVLGPGSTQAALNWLGPDGQRHQETSAMVLVSNDPYRLGSAVGSGTRPRLDTGQLGIAVVGALEPPLRFWTRPKALRVLIAPQHPGASPPARMPARPSEGLRAIVRTAISGAP